MSELNIFEAASRLKLTFRSQRGSLTVDQLWDLPLQTAVANKLDLNTIAKEANAELKELTEDNFVETRANPLKAQAEIKLAIVKHIIGVKQVENAAKTKQAADAETRRVLTEALANRKNAKINEMSEEEIIAKLASLGVPETELA